MSSSASTQAINAEAGVRWFFFAYFSKACGRELR